MRHSLNASCVWEVPLKTALRGHWLGRIRQGLANFGNNSYPHRISLHDVRRRRIRQAFGQKLFWVAIRRAGRSTWPQRPMRKGLYDSVGSAPLSSAAGRNRFRGPSYFNTDLAIMKDTRIPHWENAVLGIGFQFFNLFNHPNFGFPDNFISSPTFGQIFYLEQAPTTILGSALGGDAAPRMVQLKVQLRF